jgi:phage terminase large subunit
VTDARAVLERIRADPVWFCREVLGLDPWSKQREVLESVRDHTRTAVRSCHGAGKTAIAARAVLWFLAAFPPPSPARVITTAPTWAQVRDLLWREIRGAFHAAGGFIDGELFEHKLELAPDWFAIGLSTDRPERFQGHHAEHLLLVVDEAAGVDEGIFEAASGFLTSPGARLLLIGNPTQLSGEFFDAFHRARSFYNTVAISAFDTPAFTGEKVPDEVLRRLVSREWVEEHKAKWGEGSPLYQVRVLGDFPTAADNSVIPLGQVEAAQQRKLPVWTPAVVACDVARFGSDETVIATRAGWRVRIAEAYGGRDLMQTVGLVLRTTRALGKRTNEKPVIVIDDVGVGGGVTDRLREVGEFRVVAFNGAAKARAHREYPNRRSEAWFSFAEQLDEVDLDDDDQLAADLVAPRYSIDSHGRRVVEPKERTKQRLGRSPDRADAVLMTFATRRGSGYSTGITSDDDADRDDPLARRRERALARGELGDAGFLGYDSPL